MTTVLRKIRRHGLEWACRRLREEWLAPTTRPRRLVRDALGGAAGLLVRRVDAGRDTDLRLVYDLAVNPLTFDFAWTLAAGEAERRRLGLEAVHVVFVLTPGYANVTESDEYRGVVDAEARRWRFEQVLLPMCSLLPSAHRVSVLPDRSSAARALCSLGTVQLPPGYRARAPIQVAHTRTVLDAAARGEDTRCLVATGHALRVVGRWLERVAGDRRVVTITLREYGYMTGRNSSIDAWARFARWLDAQGFCAVVIPDTESGPGGDHPAFDGIPMLGEAAFSVPLRMALYERAWLNTAVSTGPLGLCYHSATARYLQYKTLVPDVPQASADSHRRLGMQPGQQYPFAGRGQRILWSDRDDFDTLCGEFVSMARCLESS